MELAVVPLVLLALKSTPQAPDANFVPLVSSPTTLVPAESVPTELFPPLVPSLVTLANADPRSMQLETDAIAVLLVNFLPMMDLAELAPTTHILVELDHANAFLADPELRSMVPSLDATFASLVTILMTLDLANSVPMELIPLFQVLSLATLAHVVMRSTAPTLDALLVSLLSSTLFSVEDLVNNVPTTPTPDPLLLVDALLAVPELRSMELKLDVISALLVSIQMTTDLASLVLLEASATFLEHSLAKLVHVDTLELLIKPTVPLVCLDSFP